MAKKGIDNSNVENEQGIISYPLEDLMGDRFGRYAKYIIQERALPDIRDGLKPVQRRILYAMSDLGLWFEKPHKKSARVVGEVIGKYHPHGDTSIYDAMVRMSQTWKLGMPLIDMQGNNGSIDGDDAAAMRYTETRLSKISEVMLEDLEKETVPFAPNFDDSEREPTVLPSYFPNILVNGAMGIAAGYATNMPPHNLGEVIDATIQVIKTPNTRLETILGIVKGPDFPTGGIVQGLDGIRDAFGIGKGKVIINSKYHLEDGNIIIDEIPYEVVKQDLVKKIGDVIDANPGLGIHEIRDETDRTGLRIAIDLSDKANAETVRKFLFKNTPLSISYNYNNVVIVNKQPKQLGIIAILQAYIDHYKDVFTRSCKFDLAKAEKRFEIVTGLIRVMSILDQVIKIIRASTNRADAILNLSSNPEIGLSEAQATAVVDMRLYRLTSTDVVKLEEEKNVLTALITKLTAILTDDNILDKEIIDRLREVKKQFPTPRRTELSEMVENLEVEFKDTLVEKRFHLWISKAGYLKAIDPAIINKNDQANFGRKPNDSWIAHLQTTNLHHLILISNVGTYYSIPLYKVTMSKWKEMGMHVNTVATMDGNETIVAALAVKDLSQATQQILVTTKLGLIKRTPIVDLETKIFTRAFKLMKLADQDEVVSASLVTSATNQAFIVTEHGYGVRYNICDIPVQGTSSKGVKAANLKDDHIIAGKTLEDIENILLLTDKDNMKKVSQFDMPLLTRPKRGTRLFPERKRGIELVTFAFSVINDDILYLLNNEDQYHDLELGRVKILDLKDTTITTGIENIIDASLEKDYLVTNGDLPPVANNDDEEAEEYVAKTEKVAKTTIDKENNKNKVSSRVTITSDIKNNAKQLVETYSSGYGDILDDISSLTAGFNQTKKEVETKNKAKQDSFTQLDFDDLFADDNE